MKKNITPINGTDLVRIQADEDLASRLNRVSQLATRLLAREETRFETAATDADILTLLEHGALGLTLLAKTPNCPMIVDPVFLFDSHTAACQVAFRLTLTGSEREDVLETLGFLSGLLPLQTVGFRLPRWKEFQTDGNALGRGKEIYDELRSQDTSITGLRQITLRDALVLRECLRLRIFPSIQKLWKDLDYLTMTHRYALARLVERPA